MSAIPTEELNGLIYMTPLSQEPTRYEMIRYSTWRVYLYQEFESLREEQITALESNQSWIDKYPQLVSTKEEKAFYLDLLSQFKNETTLRQDMISHFICRMLYCYDSNNHSRYIEMEKLILRIKLKRKVTNDVMSRVRQMEVLKRLLAFFLEKKPEDFDVGTIDW